MGPDLSGLLTGFGGLNGLLSSSHTDTDPTWLQAALGPQALPEVANCGVAANSATQPDQAPKKKRGRPRKNPEGAPGSRPRPKHPVQELEQELSAKLSQLHLLEKENELLTQRYKILEKVVEARDDHMRKLQQAEAGDADAALSLFGLTAESMVRQSFKDLANKLRELMAQVGSCLMQSTVTGNQQPVVALINQVREVSKFMFLLRPDVVLVAGRNVNELCAATEDVAVAPESHWSSVVSQLHLRVDQARCAWLLHDMYTRWLAALLGERARLSDMLGQVLSVNRYGNIFTHATAGRYTDSMLVDKINQNLISERCLIVLVADVFHSHVLAHTQVAECMLHSYPYAPDDIALLAAAAQLHAPPTSAPAPVLPSSTSVYGGAEGGASGSPPQPHPTLSAADLTKSVATAQGITLNTDALPLIRHTTTSNSGTSGHHQHANGAPVQQQGVAASAEVAAPHIHRPTITTCMEPAPPPAAISPSAAAAPVPAAASTAAVHQQHHQRMVQRNTSTMTVCSGRPSGTNQANNPMQAPQSLSQQAQHAMLPPSSHMDIGNGSLMPLSKPPQQQLPATSTTTSSGSDAPTSLPASLPWAAMHTTASTAGTAHYPAILQQQQQQPGSATAGAAAANIGGFSAPLPVMHQQLSQQQQQQLQCPTRSMVITTSASGNTQVQPGPLSPSAAAAAASAAAAAAARTAAMPIACPPPPQHYQRGGVPRQDSGLGSGSYSGTSPLLMRSLTHGSLGTGTQQQQPGGGFGAPSLRNCSGSSANLTHLSSSISAQPSELMATMSAPPPHSLPAAKAISDPSTHTAPPPLQADAPLPSATSYMHSAYLAQQQAQHVQQQQQQYLSSSLQQQQQYAMRACGASSAQQQQQQELHLAPLRGPSAMQVDVRVLGYGAEQDEAGLPPAQRMASDGNELWSLFSSLRRDGEPLWPARA